MNNSFNNKILIICLLVCFGLTGCTTNKVVHEQLDEIEAELNYQDRVAACFRIINDGSITPTDYLLCENLKQFSDYVDNTNFDKQLQSVELALKDLSVALQELARFALVLENFSDEELQNSIVTKIEEAQTQVLFAIRELRK